MKIQPESKQNALTWVISPCQTTWKINLELTIKVVLTHSWHILIKYRHGQTRLKQRMTKEIPITATAKQKTKKMTCPCCSVKDHETPVGILPTVQCVFNIISISFRNAYCFPWKSCQILNFKEHKRENKFMLRHSPLCGKCRSCEVQKVTNTLLAMTDAIFQALQANNDGGNFW